MRRLVDRFPGLKLFSLPHLAESEAERYILLGFRGRGNLTAAMDALRAELAAEGLAVDDAAQPGE
jgi:hypothetical protein